MHDNFSNYLKAQLIGDAARTIEGSPLTDDNHFHVIPILKNKCPCQYKNINTFSIDYALGSSCYKRSPTYK